MTGKSAMKRAGVLLVLSLLIPQFTLANTPAALPENSILITKNADDSLRFESCQLIEASLQEGRPQEKCRRLGLRDYQDEEILYAQTRLAALGVLGTLYNASLVGPLILLVSGGHFITFVLTTAFGLNNIDVITVDSMAPFRDVETLSYAFREKGRIYFSDEDFKEFEIELEKTLMMVDTL